jgi:hypothetical protein
MLRGGHERIRRTARYHVAKPSRLAALAVLAAVACLACGGGTAPAKTTTAAKKPEKAPPGVPAAGDEGWCDPMPELGDNCKTELKECTIVCDYISDTCAALVCLGSMWEYVERGEGAEQEE